MKQMKGCISICERDELGEGGPLQIIETEPISPPVALLKGLLGERAGWEVEPEPELNGLGKSETQRGTQGNRGADKKTSESVRIHS